MSVRLLQPGEVALAAMSEERLAPLVAAVTETSAKARCGKAIRLPRQRIPAREDSEVFIRLGGLNGGREIRRLARYRVLG